MFSSFLRFLLIATPLPKEKKRKKGTTVTTFSDFGFEATQKVVNTVDDQENAGK